MHRHTRQNSTNDNTRHSISTNRFLLTNRSTSLRRYLPSSIALVNHLAKLERIDRSSFLDAKSVLMLKIRSAVPPRYCLYFTDVHAYERVYARTSEHTRLRFARCTWPSRETRVNRFWCFNLAHPVYIYNARPRRITYGNARVYPKASKGVNMQDVSHWPFNFAWLSFASSKEWKRRRQRGMKIRMYVCKQARCIPILNKKRTVLTLTISEKDLH